MSTDIGDPLDDRDEALALALASGKTRAKAAKAVGVSVRTVYNRLAVPEFAARIKAIQNEALERVVGRLTDMGETAADALEQLLTSKNEGIRIQAATIVLAQLKIMREHYQFAERLQALEQRDREREETYS